MPRCFKTFLDESPKCLKTSHISEMKMPQGLILLYLNVKKVNSSQQPEAECFSELVWPYAWVQRDNTFIGCK